MAKKYENVEKLTGLLGDNQLGGLQKRLSSTEKSLAEILKKLSVLETEKAERDAAEAAAYAQEQARIAAEEAAKAAAEAEKAAHEAQAKAKAEAETPAPEVEKTKKKTTKKKVVEEAQPVEEAAPAPTPAPEAAVEEKPAPAPAPKTEEKPVLASKAEAKPEARTFVPKTAPAAPRAPRYFRNGQEQGVYVAKPGVESAPTSSTPTYRPRPTGDRPARPAGERPLGNRPATPGARPARSAASAPIAAPITAPKENKNFSAPAKKKTFEKTYSEKKPLSKRTLARQQGMTVEDFDEDKSGYRKVRSPKKQKSQEIATVKIEHAVVTTKDIPLKVLSEKLGVSAVEITKRLFKEGIMKGINDSIDYDNALMIAMDMGIDLEYKPEKTAEEVLMDTVVAEDESKLVTRAPVVTVMGHVDHGKTSLLDRIRSTTVTAGEAGGITQSIGAYTVTAKGKQITFIDTPGHAAFTSMRARGAQITDVVILVVAADDGIMPQTVEAINHAKAAGIDIVVAINKMDKPTADPDTVKQELTRYDLVPEEWGGDVICVPVSAKTHKGIEDLLESVLLVAEVKELKANPNRHAKGIVIEAKLDKGRGPVATVLVQNGTLHSGDIVIAGTAVGRVRAMTDHNRRALKEAGPSVPVEIIGLADVPVAGDEFNAVADEKMARELAEQRRAQAKEEQFKANARANLNDLFNQISEGVKDLNVIVKADVDGSAEAVRASLQKLSNEEVKVRVIHSAVGGITEGDVMLAAASNAIIVGFNVRPDKGAMDSADRQNVEIRTYRVIYECIEEITAAMKGMLAPKFKEVVLGHAEVRQTIRVPNVGTIAGSYITDGKVTRAAEIRVVRDGIVIFEDKISSLKRFKDDAKEVASGYECGIGLEKFNDIKLGDVLEAFIMEEIKQ